MSTIRLNRIGFIILIIVIILIIAVVFRTMTDNTQEAAQKESKISILSRNLRNLISQIEAELESLKLTEEMQRTLERKIQIYLFTAKIAFAILFICVASIFLVNGMDLITSLANTMCIFSFAFLGVSFLCFSKFVDPNATIEWYVNWVRKIVYKRHRFDPESIQTLKDSISSKNIVAAELSMLIQHPAQ